MGFMDELKKLARPYAEDEDDFDEYEDELDELADEPAAAEEDVKMAPAREERTVAAAPARAAAPAASMARPAAASVSNVVNLHGTGNLQVMLVKPDRYENVSEVADHLRNKCAVVLNLESTNKDTARRLVDFLSGCAYALDGRIKKVATSTYIITPYNVDIVGDLMEEIENSGMYF
ncbi:MAG: cell division protein SepF [Oscillospiraceae bacterium]|nr:cell division protein SepF [Oscillospiraceae bacterium]